MSNKNNDDRDADAPGPEDEQPSHIGPYRILDVLGEGGMAVVYLAEQSEPIKRRVALKILKLGMDSKQIVARFESERQALAVLDHPHIAKVFEGGITESGRPYFVMERVRGVPITDYCDNNRLGTPQRLELFAQVCSAVQHAHHKGLIHRDIKPSNVLVGDVDGKPQPRIIDFGIAKATGGNFTEQTLVTRIGQIVGTPQYMSPEQAEITGLDVDTRTDIYSLGVVLYELLVGALPLDLAAIGDQAIRHALLETDPPKPSTRITELGDTKNEVARARSTDVEHLRKQLSGDLDWVVMRAIEKDRTRRYETANALAMECLRFLKHEPVLARPPSARYVVGRFIRRNRIVVVAASIAILAVVVGAVAATVGFVRATEAEQVAVREAQTARATTQFLVDLFQVSDPWSFSPMSNVSGDDITAREVLNLGADRIRRELVDQPEVQASLLNAMGGVFLGLDALDEAEAMLLEGMAVRENELSADDPAIAESLRNIGRLNYLKGDYEAAVAALDRAAGIFSGADGDHGLELVQTLGLLSVTLSNKGDLQEALDVQMQAIDVLDGLASNDPLQRGLQYNNLGHVYYLLDQPQEGIAAFEEAVALFAQTSARGYHASALGNLAALYQVMGRLAEAQRVHEQALELKRGWFGTNHIEVGFGIANLSMVYMNLYDFDRAAALQAEAIDIFSSALGEDHPNVSIIAGNLAWSLKGQQRYEEAESAFREANRGISESLGAEHLNLTNLYNGLGEMYAEMGRYADAEQSYRETLRLTDAADPGYSEAGGAYAGIAALPESSLALDEREAYFVKALEILENSEGLGTPRSALVEIGFAEFLFAEGEATRAHTYFESGLAHLAGALSAENWKYMEQRERYETVYGGSP